MRAETALPVSSSSVRIGVARTASRLRDVFSPTIEYDAIESGMYAGSIRKNTRNCWIPNAAVISPGVRLDHSGRWAMTFW